MNMSKGRTFRRSIIPLTAILSLGLCVACNRSSEKRYAFKGKVVTVDSQNGTADIDNEPIPGYMESMVMSYKIKPATKLNELKPGDSISGEVVVQDQDYWLENVTVVQHGASPAGKPTSSLRLPYSGEPVPDFTLVDQNGRHISLHQYHGQTLLLTFIYTRCPFPDYCPRVSHEFAGIYRQLLADPAHYGKTHLLSISFDPEHDTPRILREYGFSCVGKKDAGVFRHWEFAVVPPAELPQVAQFFDLLYKDNGGVIVHSLSTAVVAPDGTISKWYHGTDWQTSDLLQDAAALAAHPAA